MTAPSAPRLCSLTRQYCSAQPSGPLPETTSPLSAEPGPPSKTKFCAWWWREPVSDLPPVTFHLRLATLPGTPRLTP